MFGGIMLSFAEAQSGANMAKPLRLTRLTMRRQALSEIMQGEGSMNPGRPDASRLTETTSFAGIT